MSSKPTTRTEKPVAIPTATPLPWGIAESHGRVSIAGPDGKEIARFFHPPDGNGGNRADRQGRRDRLTNARTAVVAVNGQDALVRAVRALFYLVHSLQASEGATPELIRSVTGHAADALRAVGAEKLPIMVDYTDVATLAEGGVIMPQFPPIAGMPEEMGL